jgi:PAS domain S-box-containing protein
LNLQGAYRPGDLVDGLWPLAQLLIVVSAVSARRQMQSGVSAQMAEGEQPHRYTWVPYVVVACAYGLLVALATHPDDPDLSQLIGGAVGLTALVVARQALAQRENSRLLILAATRRSEVRFRALVQHASDVITVLSPEGQFLYQSPSAERVFGYAAAGMPLDFARVTTPEDYRRVRAFLDEAGRQPRVSLFFEWRMRHADGSWRNVEGVATNLVDEADVGGILLTMRDITERKLAEQALRASEERFRRQYKGFPLPTSSWLQVGDDFVLQEFNDAADSITGGYIREWVGKRASECYALHPEVVGDLVACVAEQRTISREMRYSYRATGENRDLAVSYVFVPPLTFMLHTADVTETKQAEQHRDAMAQSEKLRALGQMASGIAHDLNQSLMLVASYSDLAQHALVQDPQDLGELQELLTTATQAALDGGETVKRLLLFTRAVPESVGKRVELGSVLREAALLTAPRWRDAAQAEGRPITLDVEVDGQPTIQGSAGRLRELMTNLIFNAVDALPTGGTIRLRAKAQDGQGIVEVTDSGVGMGADIQARVFEPFFTTKGESGTGLGLAMVFGIIEQHHGRIDVQSRPGKGTTFRMEFPLLDSSVEPEPLAPSGAPLEPPRQLRLLVVDDEPMMTKAVMRMLKPSGHLVTLAGSGEEAVDTLSKQAFDIVVSDMGMGAGMNGWELADEVKRRWPSVRFMLATGWGASINPDEASARGVEAVLSKPYQLADLLNALARTGQAA